MKKLIFCLLFLTFCAITGISFHNSAKKDNKKKSEVTLFNIEALANGESPGQFNWCKTGTIVSYGMWVLHCGNCDMQMVGYSTGEGYCYKK